MSLSRFFSQFKTKDNVEFRVVDKDGRPKKLFQQSWFYGLLLKMGIVSPLTLKIPFLFGSWKRAINIRNTTTKTGFAEVANLMGNVASPAYFTYIAVGTGTTGATSDNTTLEAEISDSGLARASATVSRVTTTNTNDTLQLVKSFSVSGTKAVTESGVFNAASVGVMAARQTFSAINVVSGDTLQITWKLKVS